jgi:hypothetical protein
MAEMMWQAGQGVKAQVCLGNDLFSFEPPGHYRKDGITEKVDCSEFLIIDGINGYVMLLFYYYNPSAHSLLFHLD